MAPGNDDARQRARRNAEALETSLESVLQGEADTAALREKVEAVANDLVELAREWEAVNPSISARVRTQEQQIRALARQVEHLGEVEADEAQQIMKEMREELRKAQP